MFIIFIYIDGKIKPRIISVCNYQINQFASDQIDKAINDAINNSNYNYTDYVNFKFDRNDQIIAIQTNARQITNVNNEILEKIGQAISKFDLQTINIHLGSISGINLLSGRGPKIPIKIVSKGITSSQIISTLEEAGINQTMHKIRLIVNVEIAGFFAGFSTKVETKSECILSESIIVGKIPNHYTKVELKNPQILSSTPNLKELQNK